MDTTADGPGTRGRTIGRVLWGVGIVAFAASGVLSWFTGPGRPALVVAQVAAAVAALTGLALLAASRPTGARTARGGRRPPGRRPS